MTWNLLLLLMVAAYLLSPIRLALLVRRWRCECGPCPKACIGFGLHVLNALISFMFIGLALVAELCLGRWGAHH